MKLKPVLRYDPTQHKFRILRLLWQNGPVGFGGWSAKLSLSLSPRFFRWHRHLFGWRLQIAGIELHYLRSFGGIIV